GSAWPSVPILPLIESPQGMLGVDRLARAPSVQQLCLGLLDLAAACGVSLPHEGFLEQARIRLTLASAAAGLAAPIDTPYARFDDPEATRRDANAAARLGFSAKLCIHPAQLAPVRAA